MISRVTIANYKSVENADFEARRVNVFIGEPNSGKSNLLEAVGLVSSQAWRNLRAAFRVEQMASLFFDQEVTREISVALGPLWSLTVRWEEDRFKALFQEAGANENDQADFLISPDARTVTPAPRSFEGGCLYYRYRDLGAKEWRNTAIPILQAPFGDNLPGLLAISKPLRESVSDLFRSIGFRLELRPSESRILMTKEVDDVLYSFPFESISETMKRIVFYKAVLESNKDAVLVLDEPEANTFPFYTKYLAERIALDTSNQFFLSTHNPYVLMSIIEKTPQAELAVYATRMRNYTTQLHLLGPKECAEALDLGMDLFLNLQRFFPE